MATSTKDDFAAVSVDDLAAALGLSSARELRPVLDRLALPATATYEVPVYPRGTVTMITLDAAKQAVAASGSKRAASLGEWLGSVLPDEQATQIAAALIAKLRGSGTDSVQ